MQWPPRALSAHDVPWLLYSLLFASTTVLVGVMWDISWHQTIGRDTFWSPPHLAIYLGGVVAGVSSGFVALQTTFAGTAGARAASVRFWGIRAPLGAWVCIWGAIAMLTSAPFDDWWHNAYGLDVKIHTDAYSHIGGSKLAAELRAVSADHMNYTAPEEYATLREAGVVSVVMPALDFAVGHSRPFDARSMLDAGMTLAITVA